MTEGRQAGGLRAEAAMVEQPFQGAPPGGGGESAGFGRDCPGGDGCGAGGGGGGRGDGRRPRDAKDEEDATPPPCTIHQGGNLEALSARKITLLTRTLNVVAVL